MPIISLAVTLLVILAGLYFLAKVKAENLGPLFKWITYLVLIVAGGLLVFQLVRGCSKVWNRKMGHNSECGPAGPHGKMSGKMMNCGSGMEGCCCAMMDCTDHCSAGGMMDCCREMGGMKMMKRKGEPGVIQESSVDTIDGKIIRKETEIIRKQE